MKMRRQNRNNKRTEIDMWLVYRTGTNARGFWLVKRTVEWKNFMPENVLEINRYFALSQEGQPSAVKWPKSHLQLSKKVIFFIVNCKKCRLILTVKKFQGKSNLSISVDLHWRISKLEKPVPIYVFKNTLTRHYKTVQLTSIWKKISKFYIANREGLS